MTRLRYGTVATLAGAALALYNWWRRRPDYVARQMSLAGRTSRHPTRGAVV
jgi:hypothetical protein